MSRTCSRCGGPAEVYAGGRYAGDWADWYCVADVPAGFSIWDRLEVTR